MPEPLTQWQLQTNSAPPDKFVQAVKAAIPEGNRSYIAQLLWQRGMQSIDQLPGFLNPKYYQPASPFEFGQEMEWAMARLRKAHLAQEAIAIWGDFDADGVTSTAVLWDGLGQFFTQQKTLFYYIPNRITESHGLSQLGIDWLHRKGCRLIVTCDTGSTNLAEIEYAHHLGMDVIVTDHHTLLAERPPVTAIINPRSLNSDHPLATLSGVAVAYKLVEALYETLPDVPQKPLEYLLDLVAIGLIADLVELRGDCRYLAQRGIEQLQKQSNPATATRPGVAKLLEFCKRNGDRPTDISFGLGPRINAVSRIHGDAHFCVELLTSQDTHLCTHLAEATELANTRRKALQKEVAAQVTQRLTQLDLSTTSVIVLADEQWQVGVLGLVAGQIAQEYGRPTILLNVESVAGDRGTGGQGDIDLYQLVKDQEHLLTRFGGHPFAAGLSLPVENLALFTEGINQKLRQSVALMDAVARIQVDLVVTVSELGKDLFQELKLLEPCGIGNPVPKLLIQNCWFESIWNQKLKDRKGGKVEYIKTGFKLCDDSTGVKFPGVWWGHYRDEIPKTRCDVVVELDFNPYVNEAKGIKPHYEVRLIALRSHASIPTEAFTETNWILDFRAEIKANPNFSLDAQLDSTAKNRDGELKLPAPYPLPPTPYPLLLRHCPSSWGEFQVWFRRSRQEQRLLAIAYPPPPSTPPQELWRQLVGIAKYLSRTGETATRQQVLDKLGIGDRALQLGFRTLTNLGFRLTYTDNGLHITTPPQTEVTTITSDTQLMTAIAQFFAAVREEQFRRQYFYQVPLTTIQTVASQTRFE